MGAGCIFFLLAVQFAKKKLPSSLYPTKDTPPWVRIADVFLRAFHIMPPILVVVVLGISITVGMRLDKMGLAILGSNPRGLPVPSLPPLNKIQIVSR